MKKLMIVGAMMAGMFGPALAYAQEYPTAMPSTGSELVSSAVPVENGDGPVTFVQTNTPTMLSQAVPNSAGDNYPTFITPFGPTTSYAMNNAGLADLPSGG